jgi:hypothetical protein
MQVTVDGYVFKPNSIVDIYFDDILVVNNYPTNGKGDFYNALFYVPEVPRGEYLVSAWDPDGTTHGREFFVFAWIVITPKSGPVGTQITIEGRGFPAEEDIRLWWGGYTEDRLDYSDEEYGIWDGYYSWYIETVGDDYWLKTVPTDELGSFDSSFLAPESWGGYHPIWAEWWEEGESWVHDLQGQVFRIVPSISITPTSGVSGQYVHLDGTGFSTWEYYEVMTDANHDWYPDPYGIDEWYQRTGTGFVLDFGTVQRYIDEYHYILNNEANFPWLIEGFNPLKIDARGTIIYYDEMYSKVSKIGSPFLQIPFLQPGDYTVTAYRFNEQEMFDWWWWIFN